MPDKFGVKTLRISCAQRDLYSSGERKVNTDKLEGHIERARSRCRCSAEKRLAWDLPDLQGRRTLAPGSGEDEWEGLEPDMHVARSGVCLVCRVHVGKDHSD